MSSTAALTETERSQLCDLMLEVGPGAPTLDEGWRVLDLAAHLVVREHDLWAAGGILWGGPFAAALEIAMQRRRRQGLESLVAKIRRGEPFWYRPVPRGAQLNEYFIHHEDVRRPNGRGPRTDRPDLDRKLARLLAAAAPTLLRHVQVGVELRWNGEHIYRHGDGRGAVLQGPPGEILLYLSGRRRAAQLDLSGDGTAVAALEHADLGI